LHAAAQAGHVRDVQLLLARGADANARDKKGETPLLKAAARGQTALLLARGADANARDKKGETPLLKAAARGQTAVCRLLLQARGDPAAASSSGATAL
ncbi:ankyrin, partial [Emiliania huxleyi CCMP1516]|uniref:Ankyrin repeat domain-containing protein n=2 Tax=Emiliania huxleyi TaxID=2903 RepID=A0A0D3IAG0_EMIH1